MQVCLLYLSCIELVQTNEICIRFTESCQICVLVNWIPRLEKEILLPFGRLQAAPQVRQVLSIVSERATYLLRFTGEDNNFFLKNSENSSDIC